MKDCDRFILRLAEEDLGWTENSLTAQRRQIVTDTRSSRGTTRRFAGCEGRQEPARSFAGFAGVITTATGTAGGILSRSSWFLPIFGGLLGQSSMGDMRETSIISSWKFKIHV